jgi:D-xylose transport system permease protein
MLDRSDERVKHSESLLDLVKAFIDRIRSGDLGMLPVAVGLIVISTVFSILNPVFLLPNNLVNLLFDCATVGIISLGIVCVLMLGEIDLSVGSMSGLSSAIIGVLWVNAGWPVAAPSSSRYRWCGRRSALCARFTAARHAELRGDTRGPAGASGAAALHPRPDRQINLPYARRWFASARFSSCRLGCRTCWHWCPVRSCLSAGMRTRERRRAANLSSQPFGGWP